MKVIKRLGAVLFLVALVPMANADLLGIIPGTPKFIVSPSETSPNVQYTAASGLLEISGQAPAMDLGGFNYVFIPDGVMQISVSIDAAGAPILPGTSTDIVITGTVTVNSIVYSGQLLTGQLIEYGIRNTTAGTPRETDRIDFRFNKTGGALSDLFGDNDIGVGLPSLFTGQPIGSVMEASTFDDDFTVDWRASKFKSDVGTIPSECTGTIGDYVWIDLNRNGLQDTNEPGLPGALVSISGGLDPIPSTTTDANGFYEFTGLACDTTYTVSVVNPDSATYVEAEVDANFNGNDTKDSDLHSGVSVTLTTANPNDETIDFGYEFIPASLGDFVWFDTNQDGIQDPGEPGIENVTVMLMNCTGTFIKQTFTNQLGAYEFTDLNPSSAVPGDGYIVKFVAPGGFAFSPQGATSGGFDSDANPDGETSCIDDLLAGQNNPDIDAGLYPGAGLGNFVWHDLNANGVQDSGEPGIPDVTVELLDCSMASLEPRRTTMTNGNGFYEFKSLEAGCYFLMFTRPAGFDSASPQNTPPSDGGSFETDSDADPGGKTGRIDLADNQFDLTWDAGFYKTASLGDRVWSDLNRNGLQDENEPGLNNCRVELLDEDMNPFGTPVTFLTTGDGNYLFDNLEPGTYFVQFNNYTLQTGDNTCTDSWVYTLQDATEDINDPPNSDDDIDSDANSMGKTAGYTLASGEDIRTVDAGLHEPAEPAISIEKGTGTLSDGSDAMDADFPTGPFIPLEGPVYWTYEVTNTGNRTLTDVKVTDSQGVIVMCPKTTLIALEGMTCTGSSLFDVNTMTGGATAGQYSNIGTATGDDPDGNEISSKDPSHYFGADPSILLDKVTSDGVQPDGDGLSIAQGTAITWKYTVTNTGNVPLEGIILRDDNGTPMNPGDDFTANCPMATLPADTSMICTAPGTATAGDYDNLGTACGIDATGATPPNPDGTPNICDTDPSRYFGSMPTIVLEKATNGVDADLLGDGPFIATGGDVTWKYVVTNTGNVDLRDVIITDDKQGAICTIALLTANGGTDMCTKMGTAQAGDYDNLGTACGIDATGATPPNPDGTPNICDTDPSRYFGSMPTIVLEKATNGVDADLLGDGPFIATGGDVTWKYVVTNTGNVDLRDVIITDDKQGAICTIALLTANGGTDMCTKMGTAQAGDYDNLGTACGIDATGATPPNPDGTPNICDTDPSRYFGSMPTIVLEKATNGVDADLLGDGPFIATGGDVTWKYVVTNTGNVDLRDVIITDDKQGAICTIALLTANGGTDMCTKMGTAQAGDYDNLGTACGIDATGATPPNPDGTPNICDTDPSRYFGSMPTIVLEKATNGVDADLLGDGPFIATGGDVTWKYVVTNTGNVDLRDVIITDDKQGAICTIALLTANGGTDMCTKMGTAQAGDYDNLGTACGIDATGATPPNPDGTPNICDTDPSRYFGSMPTIVLEKATNGVDADLLGDGPFIATGGDVTWKYVVTNTGNVDLRDVIITDDKQGAICTIALLTANGGTDMCTKMGTAQAGDYDNLGTACGIDATGATPPNPDGTPNICDTDPSRYFGSMPTIVLEKATNGVDADLLGDGPFIATGGDVTWKYVVTNTGNVDLRDVIITDDKQGAICTIALLTANGGTDMCTKMGTAQAGDYDNLGTACGIDATGATPPNPDGTPNICDTDPSRYFGLDPKIRIEKDTNGVDADDPLGLDVPQIPAGDPVTWTYVVTNLGNEPIASVKVIDSKGVTVLPVDVNPLDTKIDGDVNMNGLLDVGETWVYEATGTAEAGPYDNLGTVTGFGATSSIEVIDTDPSHYFGVAVCDLTLDKMCFVLPPPATNSAFACDKPIDSLTMIWTGDNTVWVRAWKGDVGSTSLGVKSVAPGKEITFDGFAGSPNDVFWEVFSDADLNNKIGESNFHLSCSDDNMDGPEDCGLLQGNGKDDSTGSGVINLWKLEGIVDALNTLDCTVDTTPVYAQNCEFVSQPGASCETEDKPKSLTFRYTPSSCDNPDNNNPQEGRFVCNGGTLSGDATFSLTADQDKYTYDPADGVLSDGDLITITSNGSDFESNFEFRLTGGNTTQDYEVHASCSKALAVGDVFGSFELVAFNGISGGQAVEYAYLVTNNSSATVSDISIDDDKLDVPGTLTLGAGESDTLTALAFLEGSVTNIASASGLLSSQVCASNTDSVTVTAVEPPKSCATHGKPTELEFTLDDGLCSTMNNNQGDKAKCTGGGTLDDIHTVSMTKDASKFNISIDVDNGSFTIAYNDDVGEKMPSTIKFRVRDKDGTSHDYEVHTSCSVPLAEGDIIGGLEITDFVPVF